jgi:hypothetical protein
MRENPNWQETDQGFTYASRLVRRVEFPGIAFLLSATVVFAVLSLSLVASQASAAPSDVPDEGTVQVDGRVNTILPVGNRIYLGGEFTHVNGLSRNYLAAVDATTGQLTNWAPSANARVRALAASPDGTTIYAGGSFSQVNGLARWRLVSLDATTGAVDPSWKPTADSGVHALAVSGNRLYIGGSFLSIDGQSRSHLALLDRSTGALDPSWTPSANNNTVRTLALSSDGSRVYAGGDFSTVSGQSKPYLASLDATSGALDDAFLPPSPNGEVLELVVSGGRIYTAEGGPGGAMAAYDATTGTRTWRKSTDGDAESVTTLGNEVYVAGHFELVGSQTRDAFAALDLATGALDPQWAPVAEPVGTDAWAIASDASRGRVYAGGDFTSISGYDHQRFAQFSDPLLSSDTTPPTVESVAPADTATGVGLGANAEATFSEAMDASTLDGTTFTLTKQGSSTTPLGATVSYDAQANKAVLNPSQDLDANSTYTATIKGGANGAKDLAGNALGADKVWSFTTAALAAKTRNVLAFDGIDDWASIPTSKWLNLSGSTQRSYEAWIKTGPDTNTRQFLYEEGGESNGFSMEISGGRLYFNGWSFTNGWRTIHAEAPVSPNTIYRIAGVYQASSGELGLYLDGVLKGTSSGVGSMPQHADGVALGGISGSTRDHTNTIIRAGSNFGGRLGEFRVWDHALAQDQISSEMEANLSGTEGGLIALYKLGEGSGTLLKDSGSHNLDGTISGASWETLTYTLPS